MRTFAVSINKGGQGKTTVTKTLAVCAVDAGYNVLILDMDTQQNSAGWRLRRDKHQADKPLPMVIFCGEKDLPLQLQKAEKAGCDIVFIDTPPGKSTETIAAVEVAEYVFIPFWNDQDSYEGVATTALLAKRSGKPAAGIFNFVTPGAKSHFDIASNVLKAIGIPLSSQILTRYEAHRNASVRGLVAHEAEPTGSAAIEVEGLWDWFCAFVQLKEPAHVQAGTDAHVHKEDK